MTGRFRMTRDGWVVPDRRRRWATVAILAAGMWALMGGVS